VFCDEILEELDNGNFNTAAEMEARVDELSGKLTLTQLSMIRQKVATLKANQEQQERDRIYEAYINGGAKGADEMWNNYAADFKDGTYYSGSEINIDASGLYYVDVKGKRMYPEKKIVVNDFYNLFEGYPKTVLEKWLTAAQGGNIPNGAVIRNLSNYLGVSKSVMYNNGKFYILTDKSNNAINF
jgi:hypothetical protein